VLTRDSPDVSPDGGCAITSKSSFYVFGGSFGNPSNCSNLVHVYNGGWSQVDTSKSPVTPTPRFGAGLVIANDTQIYMFGGKCGEEEADNELWQLNLATGIWSHVVSTGDSKPVSRVAHAFELDFSNSKPRLLLFGGKNTNSTFNDAWSFDLESHVWTELGFNKTTQDWPSSRSNFGSTFYGGRLVTFGGSDEEGVLNNEIWQLVLNEDCFSRTSCEVCTTEVIGCGWCDVNLPNYKCVAGASYGAYLPTSCVIPNTSSTRWTTEFLTCPLDEFPGWIIALVIIGCIVLVGTVIYFIMKMKQKSAYEVID